MPPLLTFPVRAVQAALFPVITTPSLPDATVGTAYGLQLAASSGTPPYTWSVVSAVPNAGSWLALSSSGLLTGTPGTAELELLTVRVTDANGLVGASPFRLLVNAPPPPPLTLTHGQLVTLTGSGFEAKSGSLNWLVDDHGQAAVNTLDQQWKAGYTRGNAANGGLYNIKNRAGASLNPNGNASPAGTPHSFITNILAYANAGNNADTGWRGGPYVDYTAPTLPYVFYLSCYFKCDPAWNFGGSTRNFKFFGLSTTGDVLGGSAGDVVWFAAYGSGSGPGNNTTVSYQVQVSDNFTALQGTNDAAGHSWFWNQLLSPFNLANGWLKLELECVVTSVLGTGAGYINVWCNGQLIANYQGRTYNGVNKLIHTIMAGPHFYTNDYNFGTNFNYAADYRFGVSGTLSGPTGRLARVYMSNNSNPFAGVLGSGIYVPREPQTPTAWADGSITAVVNKGALVSGPVYFGIQSESGAQQIKGPYTLA